MKFKEIRFCIFWYAIKVDIIPYISVCNIDNNSHDGSDEVCATFN